MHDHFILCGLGHVGRRVLEYLRATGIPIVALDHHLRPEDQSSAQIEFLAGDFRRREVLEQAGLMSARAVLVLTSEDLVDLSTVMTIAHLRPGLRTVVRMFNPGLVARLGKIAPNISELSTSALTSPMMALIAHTGDALARFSLGEELMQISHWCVPTAHASIGAEIATLQKDGLQIVGYGREGCEKIYFPELNLHETCRTGDRFTLVGSAGRIHRLVGDSDFDSLPELLWAGRFQRIFRMIRSAIAEIDLSVKISTSVLFGVILLSVLVFRFGMKNDTLIDAFYRTISLMTTGSDMGGQELQPGSWQKGFVSMLKLLGTALTAVFTAILTQYLVRAELGGALEIGRIPESGHVIVTGLGNVGFRVVEELLELGERVVAIEKRRDSPFISTARRLGAAVIVGDATVPELLRQAHAESAKSIVAATPDDLVNVEISLLIREMNAKKRVVVRLTDPQLAQLLRDAGNVRLAVSIPELAAPAFVAALFGNRVRNVVFAEGMLFAVVDWTLPPGDPLEGKPLEEIYRAVHLLPLGAAKLDEPIRSDQSFTGLVSLQHLQRLVKREGS